MTAEAQPIDSLDQAPDTAGDAANHKKKQILVVILLIGLLIAIATQPDNNQPASEQVCQVNEPAVEVNAPNAPGETGAASANKRQQDLLRIRELSRIELDEILTMELFAAIDPRPPRPEALLPRQPVQAIYGTVGGQAAALLGNRIVRGGQPLPEGGKIVNVTADGVQVAR